MKVVLVLILVSIFAVGCGLGPDISKDRVQRSPSPTPFVPEKPIADYLRDGGAAFTAGRFAEASESYKRAFEIEQREQRLDEKQRNKLIGDLSMAYVKTGDISKARVTLAYGISKDYNYPMFHYILACTYGEEGDEGSSLVHLSRAYEHRANMIEGETFPDPLTESSFASFADSETFKKSVAEMKSSKPRPKEKSTPK